MARRRRGEGVGVGRSGTERWAGHREMSRADGVGSVGADEIASDVNHDIGIELADGPSRHTRDQRNLTTPRVSEFWG